MEIKKILLKIKKIKNYNKKTKEKGIALLMVLSLVASILTIVGEILFQSEITMRSSVGERDLLQAEISALSCANLAHMLLGIHLSANSMAQKLGANGQLVMTQIHQALGGELYELLNGKPLGKQAFDTIKDLTKLDLKAFDSPLTEGLQNIPGQCSMVVESENKKFNLNLLSDASTIPVAKVALIRLLSEERMQKFLEEKGYSPQRLVSNIIGYARSGNAHELDGGDKGMQYDQNRLKHRPKEAPFESLEELRRVPGFHDDVIYELLSPYFTVWPMKPSSESININVASRELLAGILTKVKSSVNEQKFDDLENKKQNGLAFPEKASDAKRAISNWLQSGGSNSDNETKDIQSQLLGNQTTVFKVTVTGQYNTSVRTYVMVLQNQKGSNAGNSQRPNTPAATPGAPPPPGPAPSSSGGDGLRMVYQRFY